MIIAGKRVLITGGSSGIGFALASALLERGARIAISSRRSDAVGEAVGRLGDSTLGIVADVTTREGRERMLGEVGRAFGGLDILVNNAGGVRAGRIETVTEREIRQMIEVNLTAPILLTRAAMTLLRASGDALVVNISSGIGLVGLPFYSPYAAAKSGIAQFGEALRRELAGEGVHILTVFPTATETPMMATSDIVPPGGRDTAEGVAAATIAAIEEGALDVVRGGPERLEMIRRNREDPGAVDTALVSAKPVIHQESRNHFAL